MTLTEFFESKEVELPRGGFEEDKEAFDAFLKNVFDEYFKHVQTLGDAEFSIICSEVKNSVGKIEELYEQIVSAVKQHLDGFPSRAYETFVKSLKAVNSHI